MGLCHTVVTHCPWELLNATSLKFFGLMKLQLVGIFVLLKKIQERAAKSEEQLVVSTIYVYLSKILSLVSKVQIYLEKLYKSMSIVHILNQIP